MAHNYVKAIAMTSINATTFTGAYLVLNATGLEEACFMIRITNATDRAILISYDGVIDHDYLAIAGVLQLPFQSNSSPSGYVANLKAGTKIYIKAAAGTGLVYLSGYYN